MNQLTAWDVLLYVWSGLFLLCFCVGFPPLALLYLLYPVWHGRRKRRRGRRIIAARHAARIAWLER